MLLGLCGCAFDILSADLPEESDAGGRRTRSDCKGGDNGTAIRSLYIALRRLPTMFQKAYRILLLGGEEAAQMKAAQKRDEIAPLPTGKRGERGVVPV